MRVLGRIPIATDHGQTKRCWAKMTLFGILLGAQHSKQERAWQGTRSNKYDGDRIVEESWYL